MSSEYAISRKAVSPKRDQWKMAVWLGISAETVLLGALLCFYLAFRTWHPDLFLQGSREIGDRAGVWCTLFMLTGGLFSALAARSARESKTAAMVFYLWATLVCGIIFLWVIFGEFSHLIQGGLLWSGFFGAPGFNDSRVSMYFGTWFLLNGALSLHVIAGLFLLSRLATRAMRYEFSGEGSGVIESFNVFWQMGLLFWMVIFALLYLI